MTGLGTTMAGNALGNRCDLRFLPQPPKDAFDELVADMLGAD